MGSEEGECEEGEGGGESRDGGGGGGILLAGLQKQQRKVRGAREGWNRGRTLTSVAGRTGGSLVLRGTVPGDQCPTSGTDNSHSRSTLYPQ